MNTTMRLNDVAKEIREIISQKQTELGLVCLKNTYKKDIKWL